MDKKSLKTLEFDKILNNVASFASSSSAKNAIRCIEPLDNIDEINELLEEVLEADRILFEFSTSPNFAFDDIEGILEKAEVMAVLSMGELLKVCRMLKVAGNVRSSICKVPDDNLKSVKAIAENIFTDLNLANDIDSAIISETEMNDNASPELRQIRLKIKKASENVKLKLNSFVTSPTYSKYLQDNIVTIRGDRYVIPVRAECRSQIPGLIHDQSASGQTVYIEPMVIVELNNTLKTYLIEEEHEIERILLNFTFRISGMVDALLTSFTKIVRLDVIFSKAMYANATKSKRPELNAKGIVDIRKGRHPLLNPDKVVPTDIRVGDDFDLLFITGPNTGGKTVSIKLIGLFELMAMSGLFVPATEAKLSLFDNVFCDIGDEQSIEQNLSTFSSHIANIVKIIDMVTPKSLVLLDELGAGTDPTEGAALATSISDYLRNAKVKAIITTHYNELKEYAVVTERVENASMDFDPVTYNPTYKLIIGTPGASNALLISKKLGLKPEIIQKAQSAVQEGKVEFENVLKTLEVARRKAVENEEHTAKLMAEAETIKKNAQAEQDRLYAQRERLNENVKKETKRLVQEAMEDANEIIASLKSLLDNPTEQNLFEARRLRKSLNKYVINEDNEFEGFGEEADGEIREGDIVLVKPLKVEGKVEKLNPIKGTALIKLGKLTSNFKIAELLKLKSKPDPKPIITFTPAKNAEPLHNEAFLPEINLIGQDCMEAGTNLDAFLDKALLLGVGEVRIIHGNGTGKLREMVKRRLRINPRVLEHRDGNYFEGNRGVTIAKLKQK